MRRIPFLVPSGDQSADPFLLTFHLLAVILKQAEGTVIISNNCTIIFSFSLPPFLLLLFFTPFSRKKKKLPNEYSLSKRHRERSRLDSPLPVRQSLYYIGENGDRSMEMGRISLRLARLQTVRFSIGRNPFSG